MKKIISIGLSFCFLLYLSIPAFATTDLSQSKEIPPTLSISPNSNSTINGETVLYSYEENGEFYVVTLASQDLPPGGGKCPSPAQTVIKSFSRAELQSLRDNKRLEYGIRTGLATIIASTYHYAYDIVFGILGNYSHGLAADCVKILDNTTKSKISVKAYFTCSNKVQAGSWYHFWKLSSVKAA